MAEIVRWGILGAANFAREQMGPAIHAAKGAELVALATRSPARAAPFRAFCPGLRVLASYDELLAAPEIDAVYIPLPNTLHVEWTKKALRAGKHVLCEKPIAMRAGEIDELIALRDATGLLAAEAYMIVHHPQWLRARELVAAGAIGEIGRVDGVFCYDNGADVGNIRNRAELGGGGIRDIGVYVFGGARFVTGQEPERLSAEIVWENGVDTFAQINARFPGFSYSAMVSMRLAPRQEMVFQGDKGVLRLSVPFNTLVFGEAQVELSRGLSVSVERFPAARHYKLQVEAFCRSVLGGVPYPCPLEFSRGTQAMIDWVFEFAARS